MKYHLLGGDWNHGFLWLSIQLGRIIPTGFHIFQRGWNRQQGNIMFFCRKSGEQNCFSWVFPTSYSLVAIKLSLWSFTNGDKRLAILDPVIFHSFPMCLGLPTSSTEHPGAWNSKWKRREHVVNGWKKSWKEKVGVSGIPDSRRLGTSHLGN